jgi:serine/threonine-protein kinase RsbW
MPEPQTLRLVLPHRPHVELEAGQAVETVGLKAGFSHDTLAEVRLAVVEACLNALEYGAGEIEVEVAAHTDGSPWLEIRVIDHGPGFEPAAVPRPKLRSKLHADRKRGWGLELMRRLMDEVEITSRPGRTQVRMIRRQRGG